MLDEKKVNVSDRKVLAYFNKFKYIPEKHASHGHSGFCLVHFSNGIPDMVNQLFELKEENVPIHMEKTVFLCTRETLQSMDMETLT